MWKEKDNTRIREDILLDGFRRSGTDESGFRKLAADIDEATKPMSAKPRDLRVLGFDGFSETAPCMGSFHYADAGNTWAKTAARTVPECSINVTEILPGKTVRNEKDADPETVREKQEFFNAVNGETNLLIGTKETEEKLTEEEKKNGMKGETKKVRSYYFVSGNALLSLANRTGLKPAMLGNAGIARDVMIAQAFDTDDLVTLVTRSYQQKGAKVLAFLGGRYELPKLGEITEVCRKIEGGNYLDDKGYSSIPRKERLGRMECDCWEITQNTAMIRYSFPDYGKKTEKKYRFGMELTPFIEISSSATGDSSFTAKGFWQAGTGARIYVASYRKEHRVPIGGSADAAAMATGVRNAVLSKLQAFPEELERLKRIKVTPDWLDVRKNREGSRNASIARETAVRAMRGMGLSKTINGTYSKKMADYLNDAYLDYERRYTAYDVLKLLADGWANTSAAMRQAGICGETLRKFDEASIKMLEADYATAAAKAVKTVYGKDRGAEGRGSGTLPGKENDARDTDEE